jgi:hypothetical protein
MARPLAPLVALGLTALTLLPAAPARADQRFFARTYDWFTPAKGEKELELWWIQENRGEADAQIEFEYGVTQRWVVAPYLLFKRETGGKFEFEGWKVEQRYRFGDFGYHRLMPAVYFEVKKEKEEPYELEGKLIGTYLWGNGWAWSGNLIFEGELKSGEKTKFGYATGISHPIKDGLRGGVELFGNWTEEEHFFGPTLAYRFNPTTQLVVNGGFRVAGPKGGAVTLLFEKEWP